MSSLSSFIQRARSKSPGGRKTPGPDSAAAASNASPTKSRSDEQEASPSDVSGQILTEEDESFLKNVTSDEETPPELPPRPAGAAGASDREGNSSSSDQDKKSKWQRWDDWWNTHNLPTRAEVSSAMTRTFHRKDKKPSEEEDSKAHVDQSNENSNLNVPDISQSTAANTLETDPGSATDPQEAVKEKRDLGSILDGLHLSSMNNKVIGISKDTQKLFQRFTQVLKDLVNGVPTAYQDLEKLLNEREEQLDKLYNNLPTFLQNLVKVVPKKAYEYFAPGLAATISAGKAAEDSSRKGGKRSYIPNLKDLLAKKGAVAAMLRSIVSFLETRFPAVFTGSNVLLSLAVFLLLFVFWYCHKRGRETRLDREKSEQDIDSAASGMDENNPATAERSADDESLEELESQVHLEAVHGRGVDGNDHDVIIERDLGHHDRQLDENPT